MEEERCDLCDTPAEGPQPWVWLTPSTAASPEDAMARGLAWFEDEEWAVCQDCHSLIVADKQDVLLMRAFTSIVTAGQVFMAFNPDGVLDVTDPRPHIIRTHEAFWANKTSFREA